MKTIMSARTLLAAGTMLTMSVCASAQKQAPPQGSAPKPFTVPAHETYSLPNGMKVTLVPYGNLPKVTVSAVVNAGNLNEPAELPGLADLMGHLMKEGTKTRSSKQVAEESADMGGSVDVNVGPDESDISTDVLSEFGPKAIGLVADVARNPLFPDSEVARIKNDMLRQLTIQKSVPQNIALMRFRKLLYGDHPYGTVFATEDAIQKMTMADVKKYYDGNFGAQRTHVYVAGRFNTAAVKKAITASFGTWSKGAAPTPDVPQVKPNHTLDLTDRPGAAQSTLYVGLPVANAASEDNIPLLVRLAAHREPEHVGIAALHYDAVAAGRQFHEPGRAVAPCLRNPRRPHFGRNLDVSIAGDHAILICHSILPGGERPLATRRLRCAWYRRPGRLSRASRPACPAGCCRLRHI